MTPTIRRNLIIYLVGLLMVLVLWHQVFLMTGVLWWNAPQPAQRLPALAPLQLPAPNTQAVDLKAFLSTHPTWNPG